MQTVEVANLSELLSLTTPREPDPVSGRRRDRAVYRGVADARWPLFTSLDRLGGVSPAHTKGELEEHILRNFLRHSRPYLPVTPENEWELLVTAQHHGLPTRLLDWTYSPLVAAHFATLEENPQASRAVWRLDWSRVHKHFELADVAFLVQDLSKLGRDGERLTPWDLFAPSRERAEFVCMLEPPSLDARIVAQSATFTICSDKSAPLDEFLEARGLGDTLTKFVIPPQSVDLVRDQLDIVSVDERRLFPDLDGVAAEMRRYYSTSPVNKSTPD